MLISVLLNKLIWQNAVDIAIGASMPNSAFGVAMWSDNEAEIDLLQFSYLANAVIRLVRIPHLLPTTIGIFGDWGSGKSTLLKIINTAFKDDQDTLCISFNGWLFEGYEDAKTALMGTILDELQDRISEDRNLFEKCRELLGKLIKRVNWLQMASVTGRFAIPALIGLHNHSIPQIGQDVYQAIQNLPSAVAQQAKDLDASKVQQFLNEKSDEPENVRRNIRDFRQDFAILLKEAGIKKLVVFIDDLDRCLPENIIETLEAIKLFLFVPGTAFIIGADERLVQYAVRQRFPALPGPEAEVGRDYLEKLIQIPIRLPALNTVELQSYLNLLFAERDLSGDEYTRLVEQLHKFLAEVNNQMDAAHFFSVDNVRTQFKGGLIPAPFESDLDLVAQVAPILAPGLGGNPRRTKRFLNTLMLRMEISDDRRLSLQRRILAKLMLLEYLKPEFFRQLAQLQAQQNGKPEELSQLEKRFIQSKEPSLEKVLAYDEMSTDRSQRLTNNVAKGHTRNTSFQETEDTFNKTLAQASTVWLADGWMQDWLNSEPFLAGVDLRPYFFVAHDKIGVLESVQVRLSPASVEILRKLLDTKPLTQRLGIRQLSGLSTAEANALFESLALRIRQAEVLDASTPFEVLFKMIEQRPDLLPQLVAFLGSLPGTKLPTSGPPLLLKATEGTSLDAVGKNLLKQWSQSTSVKLARASRTLLERPSQ